MTTPRQAVHELVSELDYPMFIVTAASEGELAGCLVGFATQCSIDPPRFLTFLSKANRTFAVARHAPVLVVHAVPEDAGELAAVFGGQTGDDVDKFTVVDWTPGPHQTPVLDACPNWFAGAVVQQVDVGDHVGFLLEPVAAYAVPDAPHLTFQEVKDLRPGHEP